MWCTSMQHTPSWLQLPLRIPENAPARLSQTQGAGGQLAASSFDCYAGTADLSVEALAPKLWQGQLNVQPLQRTSKWTAAEAHIASDTNCLAARWGLA